MKTYIKAFIVTACAVCISTASGFAMTKSEVDVTWKRLVEHNKRRQEGEAKAQDIYAELNASIKEGELSDLWAKCFSGDDAVRLSSAWSVLKTCVPAGDLSRWAEVNYLEVPSLRPRAFMVIDALYIAIIELAKIDGGEWVAADLLQSFSRSSHGRYDFLGVCPEPVAKAIVYVADETHIIGNWTPREVVGELPIARCVSGSVTRSTALENDMVFLDGAGIPAANGFYAWDRPSGMIYNLVEPSDTIRIND